MRNPHRKKLNASQMANMIFTDIAMLTSAAAQLILALKK